MTLNTAAIDAAVAEIGADAIDVCCRYQISSAQYGIDLETQTYKALDLLARGGTLAKALACINGAHPFAYKVVAALKIAAPRLAQVAQEHGGAQSPLIA